MVKMITGCAAAVRKVYGVGAGLCLVLFVGLTIVRAAGDWRILGMAEEMVLLTQTYMIMLGISFLVWRSGPQDKALMTKGRILCSLVLQILFLLAAAALILTSVATMGLAQNYITPALNIPKSVSYCAGLAGGVGIAIQSAANLVLLFQKGGAADGKL